MRWLHISDVHFGYDNASVSTMRKKLLDKVLELEPVNYLFITGDLRYGKNVPKGYPPETLDFLLKLRNALRIDPENVFMVPGNHDVDRSKVLTSVIEGMTMDYSTLDGKLDQEALTYIASQREDFKKIYREVCGRDEPDCWHYCETRGDYNIICLNTAMLCGRDGEDGNLIVGGELLNQLTNSVDSSKPAIVLAHHDFDALRLEEQQKLEICLKDLGAVLYLCGHKHVVLSRQQNTYRKEKDLNVFLCGTNMDQASGMSQTDMDFLVGQIDNNNVGWVQAFKWHPRVGLWMPDNEFSAPQGAADDGKIYFPKDMRPNKQPELRKDVLKQYREYIRIQCSEIELNGMPINEQEVSRKFALRRLFVPLRLKYNESFWWGNKGQAEDNSPFVDPVPAQGTFHNFILSDPGGGKSTLLKWIASVYCFPEEYQDMETHLPGRELFPVWIRCRDIPEGSRPTIWNMIQNIATQGEWLPHRSDVADFISCVEKYLNEEKLLLLIDGLDEIGSDPDREHFVEQLQTFVTQYPQANVLITSRPTGLQQLLRGKFTVFQYLQIDSLNPDDIKSLCLRWNQIVRGDTAEVRRDVDALVTRIVRNEQILQLARNPMLLTTILLVERRVGKLPTKRAELYEDATRVLLETWNTQGHSQHHIDLDEARYQLSYIAYYMTTRQAQKNTKLARITRSELLKIIRTARKELSELISCAETPSQFVRNVESRSALLIQKGYEENESGEREAVYEFQHLTFQEYLCAYAVTHYCYPGASEDDDLIEVLSPHLTNPNMREVIPLVAVRLQRFYPSKLADELMRQLDNAPFLSSSHDQLRDILLQMVADETALPQPKIDQILQKCFQLYYCATDINLLRQIMEGRNSDRLVTRFQAMDQEENEEIDYHVSVLNVLSGKIADPIQHYYSYRDSPNMRERANAVSVLCCPIAFFILSEFPQRGENITSFAKSELFLLLDEDCLALQQAALWGVQDCGFIYSPEAWHRYINCIVRYADKSDKFFSVVDATALPDAIIPLENEIRLSNSGFQHILNAIKNCPIDKDSIYGRMVTLAFIATVTCEDDHDLSSIYLSLRDIRRQYIERNPSDNDIFQFCEERAHPLLQQMILERDCCEKKKNAIRDYIKGIESDWAEIE